MTYTVHSIFKTIQGEGAHTGRTAVFCRFAGCNLWSGREQDREAAICKFCDTEFVGGQKFYSEKALADAIERCWGHSSKSRMVVLTGGEPGLQVDRALCDALKDRLFYLAIETNGTVKLDLPRLDWQCVSPKAGTEIVERSCDELKFVFPQDGMTPDQAADIVTARQQYSIQPMDGPRIRENVADAVEFVTDNPKWRLGIQAHKQWGVA